MNMLKRQERALLHLRKFVMQSGKGTQNKDVSLFCDYVAYKIGQVITDSDFMNEGISEDWTWDFGDKGENNEQETADNG